MESAICDQQINSLTLYPGAVNQQSFVKMIENKYYRKDVKHSWSLKVLHKNDATVRSAPCNPSIIRAASCESAASWTPDWRHQSSPSTQKKKLQVSWIVWREKSCQPVILIDIDFSSHSPQTSFNGTKDPMSPQAAANKQGVDCLKQPASDVILTIKINKTVKAWRVFVCGL